MVKTWHDVGSVLIDEALVPGVSQGNPESGSSSVLEGMVKGFHVQDQLESIQDSCQDKITTNNNQFHHISSFTVVQFFKELGWNP